MPLVAAIPTCSTWGESPAVTRAPMALPPVPEPMAMLTMPFCSVQYTVLSGRSWASPPIVTDALPPSALSEAETVVDVAPDVADDESSSELQAVSATARPRAPTNETMGTARMGTLLVWTDRRAGRRAGRKR